MRFVFLSLGRCGTFVAGSSQASTSKAACNYTNKMLDVDVESPTVARKCPYSRLGIKWPNDPNVCIPMLNPLYKYCKTLISTHISIYIMERFA